jgi:hypothetical protein
MDLLIPNRADPARLFSGSGGFVSRIQIDAVPDRAGFSNRVRSDIWPGKHPNLA